MANETVEQVKARIAQAEADKQAELDKKLAEFDRQVTARKARVAAQRQAEQQQKEEAERAAAEAKFERDHMQPALRAWLANGGTLAEFEKAKPQLRQEKLTELSLRGTTVREQWGRSAMRRYR